MRLRARSLDVFLELAKSADCVVSKTQLIENVWKQVQVTDDSLTKCISDIRKALSDSKHTCLKTIPRQGYILVSDQSEATPIETIPAAEKQLWRTAGILSLAILAAVLLYVLSKPDTPDVPSPQLSFIPISGIEGTPILKLVTGHVTEPNDSVITSLLPELKSALSRYKSLKLTESADTHFALMVNASADNDRLSIELQDNEQKIVFAQTYPIDEAKNPSINLAKRVAAAIASPGVGALDRHLLKESRLTPVDQLTHAECFAHGFGCAKCSGEEDNITKRAEACLAHVLEESPENARAWGLQASIYAHQYWWGNTLPEPLRSNLKLRHKIPAKAIKAANKAESLSSGDDSAIYWGMAEAYYSACETDKMGAAIDRGLEISPDDPNLLAAFGNWLSYSGKWDEGSALTQRALDIEPRHYRRWWWMGLAKTHYFKEEFELAYEDFLKSFNERNWISHLQLAYTLPHLDRLAEAQKSVNAVQDLYPGVTVEKALEQYKTLCFPDSFLTNMRQALLAAGLPSRGNSDEFSDIVLPRAEIVELDDYAAEYIDHGEGETVLFVHGSMSDYRTFGYYLAPISEDHRFVTYSRRYFGTQDWRDDGERFTTQQHVKDLIAFIEKLELGSVHAVSWSSSGGIVTHATLARPDLFKSAVYYEPVDFGIFRDKQVDNDKLSEWDSFWGPVSDAENNNDLELASEYFMQIVFETGEGGFQTEREAIQEVVRQNARVLPIENSEPDEMRFNLTCELASQSNVPSVVVKGEHSHYFFTQQAELFSECLASAQLVTLPGVNHRGPVDAVKPMSKIILDLVGKHK